MCPAKYFELRIVRMFRYKKQAPLSWSPPYCISVLKAAILFICGYWELCVYLIIIESSILSLLQYIIDDKYVPREHKPYYCEAIVAWLRFHCHCAKCVAAREAA